MQTCALPFGRQIREVPRRFDYLGDIFSIEAICVVDSLHFHNNSLSHPFCCWMWPQRLIRSGPSPPISPSCLPQMSPSILNASVAPRLHHLCTPGCRGPRVWRCRRLTCWQWDPPHRCSTQTRALCIPMSRGYWGDLTVGRLRARSVVLFRRVFPRAEPPPSPVEGLGPTAPSSCRRYRLDSLAADCQWCLSRGAPRPSADNYRSEQFPRCKVIPNCSERLRNIKHHF